MNRKLVRVEEVGVEFTGWELLRILAIGAVIGALIMLAPL